MSMGNVMDKEHALYTIGALEIVDVKHILTVTPVERMNVSMPEDQINAKLTLSVMVKELVPEQDGVKE